MRTFIVSFVPEKVGIPNNFVDIKLGLSLHHVEALLAKNLFVYWVRWRNQSHDHNEV